jgi:hypothetical protein
MNPFRRDGKNLASASLDSTVMLFGVDFESLKARACRIANSNLTCSEWRQFLGDEPYRKTCPELLEPQE